MLVDFDPYTFMHFLSTLKRRNAIRIPPSRQDRTQTSLEQYRTLIDRGYEESRSLGVQPDVRERRNYVSARYAS